MLVVLLAVWCSIVLQVHCVQPGAQVYSIKFHSQESLHGWQTAPWATLVPGYEGNLALQVTVPVPGSGRPETRSICGPVNLSQYSGYSFFVTTLLKAENVSRPLESYNGVKVMLHYEGAKGEQGYANAQNIYGSFDWNNTIYSYLANIFIDVLPNASLCIGLQDSSGTILVDSVNITVFRVPPPPLPTPPINPPPPWTGHPTIPRFRGTMSPIQYYDPDIQNLGMNWKANLMRWQMNWVEGTFEQRNNLTLYDEWLTAELNETDYLLAACLKYGIKVVVDLHTPPGGRDPVRGDMYLLNLTIQNHLYTVWNIIARRYKGHPAVWGYDIANEPLQVWPGEPGTLQWQQLAQNVVAVIRNIDPDITILLEAEGGGDPYYYFYFRPINDSKVVYEVHMYSPSQYTFQGLGPGHPPIGAVYPGMVDGVYWNITQLQTNEAALLYPRQFQLAFNVHMYAGEFSALRWAANGTAVNYLRDCITTFEEWGWDWSYHAYREFQGWSVEYDENINDNFPVNYTTPRKALLLSWFAQNTYPYPPSSNHGDESGGNKIHIN